ncbi:MAG TPA: ABC transporter substrate-binding protein [Acidimicrobiales bacterium]|nr:ABC transporter substrate-binding protein [Acidimicrobiales bacterium]
MPRSYDRRTFIANGLKTTAGAAALGGTGALLDACGGSSKGGGGTTTTPPTTYNVKKHLKTGWGSGTPVRGGTLTIGTEADESGFDPSEVAFDSTGVMYARTIYDPLAITLADGTIEPYLAESITPNADYTSWEITLRPNVLFHDGTACDGAALLLNMKTYLASPLVNFTLTYVDSISQTGPLSVTINMKNPWVSFNAWLAGYIGGQIAYVFAPNASHKKTLNLHPVGTGPFVFESWQPNVKFTATANPHYWRKDSAGRQLPYVDSITFLSIPDVASRFSALQTGEIDLMHTDDDPTILQIRSLTSGYAYVEDDVITVGQPDMDFLMINTAATPLNDIRLRRAMAYAFNQPNYRQVICEHVAGPTDGLFPPGNEYYNPAGTGYPTYNPAKAKALVQAWMHDNGGQPPVVPYGVTQTPESERAAATASTYFTAVGFKVQPSTVQQAQLIGDAVLGFFHVLGWRQFANVDPDLNYVFWAKTAAVSHTGGFVTNFARFQDNVVQSELDKARQTADHATRVAAYQAVEQRICQDLPYIFTDRDVWNVCANTKTQNWNHPTDPQGHVGLGMLSGIIWPTEIWKTT